MRELRSQNPGISAGRTQEQSCSLFFLSFESAHQNVWLVLSLAQTMQLTLINEKQAKTGQIIS